MLRSWVENSMMLAPVSGYYFNRKKIMVDSEGEGSSIGESELQPATFDIFSRCGLSEGAQRSYRHQFSTLNNIRLFENIRNHVLLDNM